MQTLRRLSLLAAGAIGCCLAAACAEGGGTSSAATKPAHGCSAAIGSMPGAEDFDVDRDTRGERLLVSAYDRRRHAEGGLFELPVDARGAGTPRLLASESEGCPLRPHGVSLVRSEADGAKRLYVVQHAIAADDGAGRCVLPRDTDGRVLLHQVVVFRLEGDALVHEQRLADRLLESPNDLAALPDGTLYATNEISHRSLPSALVEWLGWRVGSSVVHYDPRRAAGAWRRVLRGPRFPNGVLVQGDRLFVAGTLDRAVHGYLRDPRSGDVIASLGTIWVGSMVDNLMPGEAPGVLLVAAHPDMDAFLAHAKDPVTPSPWEGWQIDVDANPPRAERLLVHPGGGVDAAATFARVRGAFWAGQVFGRGLVRCTPGAS